MVKAFLALALAGFLALAYVSVPHAIMRTCPVCEGTGYYEPGKAITVSAHGKLEERKQLLCPFCSGGRLSLYDLRERRPKMLRWMVLEQKLPPGVLVKRVKDAFGQQGLDELHANNFFMNQGR